MGVVAVTRGPLLDKNSLCVNLFPIHNMVDHESWCFFLREACILAIESPLQRVVSIFLKSAINSFRRLVFPVCFVLSGCLRPAISGQSNERLNSRVL